MKTSKVAAWFRVKLASDKIRQKLLELIRQEISLGERSLNNLIRSVNEYYHMAKVADLPEDQLDPYDRPYLEAARRHFPGFNSEEIKAIAEMIDELPTEFELLPPDILNELGVELPGEKPLRDMDANELFDKHTKIGKSVMDKYPKDKELIESIRTLNNIAQALWANAGSRSW